MNGTKKCPYCNTEINLSEWTVRPIWDIFFVCSYCKKEISYHKLIYGKERGEEK